MSGQSARQRAASLRNLSHARAHHRGKHPKAKHAGGAHKTLAGQPHAAPKIHLAAVRMAASPVAVRVKHLARVKLHL
jgi:hypothetical protein